MTGISVLGLKGQSARRSMAASTMVPGFGASTLLRADHELWTDIAAAELAAGPAIWQAAAGSRDFAPVKKILVAVKRVVDHNVRIRVRDDGSGVETDNVRLSMNPFDRHAVEAAVQLAEKGQAEEIVVVSIGPKGATDVILSALAMGAHRGVLIETDAALETLAVAKLLAALAGEEGPDLVLLGKQAVDDDSSHVGQMLAGLLDWPQATFASGIEVAGDGLKITREVDFGRVEVGLSLPAVVTADLRLNTPRNAALPMVMKARQKPLAARPAEAFGVDLVPRLVVERVASPRARAAGETVADIATLARIIVDKAAETELG
jgi:electron transfer flavoprotein beta subunit